MVFAARRCQRGRSAGWRRVRDGGKFCRCFKLEGSRLRRPPRGFPADHPLVEDLKWTDFVGVQDLGEREVLDSRFADRVATSFAAARPWMRFLCDAIRVPF